MTTFDEFVFAFPQRFRLRAGTDDRLSTLYWTARRQHGYDHDALVGLAHGLEWADNPIGLVISRIRKAIETPPQPTPRRVAGGLANPHKPCPDGHHGCVLCACDGPVVHHVAEPMPDWFRGAWSDLLRRTVIPP